MEKLRQVIIFIDGFFEGNGDYAGIFFAPMLFMLLAMMACAIAGIEADTASIVISVGAFLIMAIGICCKVLKSKFR